MRSIVVDSVAHKIPARLGKHLLVFETISCPEPVGVQVSVVACLPLAILHLAIGPKEDAVRLDKAYARIRIVCAEVYTLDGIEQVRVATVIHDVLAVDAFAMRYRLRQSHGRSAAW